MSIEKGALKALVLSYLAVEAFTLPIFRSGMRGHLTLSQWIVNHTIFGPPVEYVPEEDYACELQNALPVGRSRFTLARPKSTMAHDSIRARSSLNLLANGAGETELGLRLYPDLGAKVRNDGRRYSVRSLVQPQSPLVGPVAEVLHQANDFIVAAWDFVHQFTTYKREVGEFWALPDEMLEARKGDCDDSSILLCSILRCYLPADAVYCAVGTWQNGRSAEGHMWVVMEGDDGEDRTLESTASPEVQLHGSYDILTLFNDRNA
ncbi:MAG: hypothetical protein ABIH46_06800, partial [Chloroflexota bacterium]